jgi:uncharacterized repeat protein (TIGR01451 family)
MFRQHESTWKLIMSESDTPQDDGPRFPKAILGRIVAVGLFIALGTFAVMQSMQGNDPSGENKTLAQSAGDVAGKVKTGIGDAATKVKNAASNVFGKKDLDSDLAKKRIAPSFNANLKTQVTTNTPDSKVGGGFKAPESKSFSNTAVTVSKPPTSPRYAQAPSGIPIVTSQGGFAARADNLQKAASNTINKATQNAADIGNNLKTGVANRANDLLKGTQSKINATAESLGNLKSNAASAFNGTVNKQFGPNPAATKPSVQSSFGSTTKAPANRPFGPAPSTGNRSFGGPAIPSSIQTVNTSRPLAKSPAPNTPAMGNRNLAPISSSPSRTTQNSKSAFDSVTSTRAPNTALPPIRSNSPPTNSFGGPRSFSSTTTPASTVSTSAPKINSQPTRQRSSIPRANVPARPASTTFSGQPANGNRPVSRLATSSAPSSMTRNVPGDRELEGVQAPALTVEKLAPREIQVNQPADFQIIVKNVGRVTAEDVRVFDQIPEGTEYQTAAPEPASLSRTRDLEWKIGSLRPGQEKRIKLQLKPVRPGEIGSVAHVTFSTQASMRTLVTKPVLEITHQAKQTHLIGDDVMFDVIVKNKGDGAANNVLIQEDVPRQLEYQDGYRELEYEIGTLMPGQSRRVQLSLKAAEIGKTRNVMFASAEGGLKAKHEIDLEIIAPKLVARTNGPTKRFLERGVTHQFEVSNQGTANATNVELVARLPSGLRYVSANNQGRYDASNHSVFWSLAELGRDVEASVELKTMPVEVGNQPIKFETFADLDIRDSAEQPLSVEHLVDVFFDIDDVVDPIEIGSDTRYKVRVVNQGTKTATNVQLQVAFPTGIQPTSVEGSLRHNITGQQIVFEPINSMSPGDEITFVINGSGRSAGDHRVVVNMRTDGRQTPVSKEETTRVYSDR